MRATISRLLIPLCNRYKLEEGMETAVNWDVDKSRDQWLFSYPAQVRRNV